MTQRQRLANRRAAETFGFECNGLHYTASISRFPDGSLAEIFIGNAKAGSHSDAAANQLGDLGHVHAGRGAGSVDPECRASRCDVRTSRPSGMTSGLR